MSTALRLPTHSSPERYELTLAPDLENQTFAGEVLIRINVHEATSSFTLNALELDIQSATLTDNDVTKLSGSLAFDPEAQMVTVNFDRVMQPGIATLHLTFSGAFNQQLCGIYPAQYTDDQGTTRTIQTTQFESTDCRRAFPCWDEPAFKAVFAVTLIIDEQYRAYSNGPIITEKSVGDGKKQVDFGDSMKMSTYLVAFVVGPLVESDTIEGDGIPMRVVSVPGREHLHPWALEVCEATLRYYAEYFGIPYPGGKMDMLAIPDFASGAMENMGCVTYRETALLVDPKTASRPQVERVTEVIAHENAHMWFGNLVTMKWWNGIWLNEAFATFMAAKFADQFRPQWDTWVSFALSRNEAMATDALTTTRPIEYEVIHPNDASGMFDILTYEKGCAVLRMCDQFIGEDVFREGIRSYLSTHAYGNTENSDLWDALDQASGQPVRDMMESWIFQGGFPLVSVTLNDATLQLTQERFTYVNEPSDTLWHVPLMLRYSINGEVRTRKVLFAEKTGEIELEATPDWVIINDNANGFFRTAYDDTLAAKLVTHLDQLSPLERLSLASDAWATTLAGQTDTDAYLALVQELRNETDPNVWSTMAGGLGLIENALSEAGKPAFQKRVVELTRPAFDARGWLATDDDGSHDGILRATLLGALAHVAKDPATIAEAEARYTEEMATRGTLEPEVANTLELILGATNKPKWQEHLWGRFADASLPPQLQINALMALACVTDDSLTQDFLKKALSGDIRSQDAPYAVRVLLARHSNPMAVWNWIEAHWDTLNAAWPSNAIARMLAGANAQTDPEFANRVVSFLETHPVPQSAKTIEQICERMRINAAFQQKLNR